MSNDVERGESQSSGARAAITDEERAPFDALIGGEYDNFALVRTWFEGEQTTAIACITRDGEDSIITPMYVQVTDAMFARMSDPSTGMETG